MATKVLEDGTTWIDFRKLREIELGIAKVRVLFRKFKFGPIKFFIGA